MLKVNLSPQITASVKKVRGYMGNDNKRQYVNDDVLLDLLDTSISRTVADALKLQHGGGRSQRAPEVDGAGMTYSNLDSVVML